MRTILIASQKGGAGKSTLAAHFATLADRASEASGRPALLIDCDPQGSLSFWRERRESETPILARAGAADVAGVLADAEASGLEWAIIDSPPHNNPLVASLMQRATLTVIPVRPAPFDLAAAGVTLDAARALGVPAVALLNHAPPPSRHGEPSGSAQARAVLERMGATVLGGQVSRRAALEHALVSGTSVNEYEPGGIAARAIANAWAQIESLATAQLVKALSRPQAAGTQGK